MKLIKQPKNGKKYYHQIVERYIKKGYLEDVDLKNITDKAWLLLHFTTVWPDKSTTKI